MRHLDETRERGGSTSHGHDEAVQLNHELQTEVVSLLNELKSLSIRQDEMQNERDQDGLYVRELEERVADYKKKWETVRMELRNLKGMSSDCDTHLIYQQHQSCSQPSLSRTTTCRLQRMVTLQMSTFRHSKRLLTPSCLLPGE